jgi:chromosome segregation ATPase
VLVLLTNWTATYASSIRQSNPTRDELCARAVAEVKTARVYVADLEARLDTARKQIAAAEERADLSDQQRALLREQVALLESSLKLARENVAALEKRVVELQEALNEERPKKWRNLAIGLVAGVVLAVLAGRSE